MTVPSNLVIIGTMNPWDKGVDELDVALERRFAQIDMLPDVEVIRTILTEKGADAVFIERVAAFFLSVQGLDDEMVRLGHAYFLTCVDEESEHAIAMLRVLGGGGIEGMGKPLPESHLAGMPATSHPAVIN